MATKTVFTLDGSMITNACKSIVSTLKKTRIKISNKEGKSITNMPLFLAILLGIILPVLTIAAVIIVLALSYKVSIEYEKKADLILIDKA